VPAVPCTPHDRAHLARAVAWAETARGRTAPNPAVGCVLVRDGAVVGAGATAPVGGPHAEAVALTEAGARARGATAYVTLEPCAHHGRTPPCADALAAAGVARVVYAHADPNPAATGGGAVLARLGVEVSDPTTVGAWFRDTVAAQLEGFLTAVRHRRPHVTLKLAQTADGRLTAPGAARWITGTTARAAVHRWRSAVDGVVVGIGTVLADDPRLDVRHARHVERQPRPIVLDTHLRTPVHAAVVRRGALVVGGAGASARRRAALEDAGAEVAAVPTGGDGRLALPDALGLLADRGCNALLAEPGGTLARALLDADLVDRLVLHVGLDLGEGPARRVLRPDATWTTERCGGAGTDLILQHVRPREVP
jgi:diaminohydroxyphosphoribosylaminopyrimidine deaminase / 5-amino-6-(5-phosphoribosylamino)uracil reductase